MSSRSDYSNIFNELKKRYKYNITDGVLYSKTWCEGGTICQLNNIKEAVYKEKPINIQSLYKKIISLIAIRKITTEQKDCLFKKYVQLVRSVDEYGYPGTRIYLSKYQIEIEKILNELELLELLKNPLII